MAITKCGVACLALFAFTTATQAANVTTYHYDNLRTGWNSTETVLTPQAVSATSFGLLTSVSLDEQVDAQPLVMTGQSIASATHDVVYVATENNTVYALDATSGAILAQRNLGAAVPQSALPGDCNNNSQNVGITGTPVIDANAKILYVIADIYQNGKSFYFLHALNIDTLADTVAPVRVSASATLFNGTKYVFSAPVHRQRVGLLLANGNVYAGFASFCDMDADTSRGWVLGWQAGTLTPLAANEVTDKLAVDADKFFLSSVWMSGSGLAASAVGDIYFVTGNSDYSGTAYNAVDNVSESVVQMSADLTTLVSVFTPVGGQYGHVVLDQNDTDFGAGGIMLLPPQSGASSNLGVAAGKDGVMYLLNADNLRNGAPAATGSAIEDHLIGGGCWCAASYYMASDGFGRIVSSGGNQAITWKVTGGAAQVLTRAAVSGAVQGNQDPGFFTSVSSNGTKAGSVLIWAVGRPADSSHDLRLYAFGELGRQLFSAVSGTWPNTDANANLVPVVANGKVYVGGYKTLSIFGPGATGAKTSAPRVGEPRLTSARHEVTGIVQSVSGSTVTLLDRAGKLIEVDAAAAFHNYKAAPPAVGRASRARGTIDDEGVVHADTLLHAKDSPALWAPDH